MFTINTKKIRYNYNTLTALIKKSNLNVLTDIYTRAKSISKEEITQIFSERQGKIINATTKNIDNVTFIIFLDETNNILELSPYIHIKDTNGQIILTWNFKDDIVTLPTQQCVTNYSNEYKTI